MKGFGVAEFGAEFTAKDNTVSYFGGCPECGSMSCYMNVHREQWFVCDQHRTKWWGGMNIFSSWQYETAEQWARNAEQLADYREVEPVYPTDPSGGSEIKDAVDAGNWPF
jgi:hypothetical protein